MSVAIGFFCLQNSKQKEEDDDDESEHNEAPADEDKKNELTDDADDDVEIKISKEENDDNAAEHGKKEDEDKKNADGTDESAAQSRNIRFYVLMFFGSLYLMMIITQWDTKAEDTAGRQSDKVVMANLIAHWCVVLLYFVTLVAPMVCPDRFAFDEASE